MVHTHARTHTLSLCHARLLSFRQNDSLLATGDDWQDVFAEPYCYIFDGGVFACRDAEHRQQIIGALERSRRGDGLQMEA